jgi:hypothetical protein
MSNQKQVDTYTDIQVGISPVYLGTCLRVDLESL